MKGSLKIANLLSRRKIFIYLVLAFCLIGLTTLPHYGTNWDAYVHLTRGQAYLNYFSTGKKDYSNLLPFKGYFQNPQNLFIDSDKVLTIRRSIYQSDRLNFNYYIDEAGAGHPPLSDIASAFFNKVLFVDLGLVNDVDSSRIYGVVLASILVGLVFLWVSELYGKVSGVAAALLLALYPLFWSESHFNTEKDIPETVFYSLFLYTLWKAFTKKSWKWILLSGVFFGLALGTKLNILFSIFIVVPWLVIFLFRKNILAYGRLFLSGLVALAVGMGVFFGSWPYLWDDTWVKLLKVLSYYQEIGTSTPIPAQFLGPLGLSFYPLTWIFFTTPPGTLILFFIGLIVIFQKLLFKKDSNALLFLLWLLIPIMRVTWPGASVYGGVRQVMEYIPAMVIIAGIGVGQIHSLLRKSFQRRIFGFVIFLLLLFNLINLYKIHPYENVYFNSLIGGLKGAKAASLPYWGFSFGAPYREAAIWLNNNALDGSKIVFAHELWANIPEIFLKSSLKINNNDRSGYLRKGEYAVTLVYEGVGGRSYYDEYLDKFLNPVYEIKVDDVSILKIWKNDDQHLKKVWSERIVPGVTWQKINSSIRFDLHEKINISRLEVSYKEANCKPIEVGYVQVSIDGKKWQRMIGNFPGDWKIGVLGEQPKNGHFIEPFVGQEARYIDVIVSPANTCLENVTSYKVYRLE